jgi:undecaprenyl-diphosphatase
MNILAARAFAARRLGVRCPAVPGAYRADRKAVMHHLSYLEAIVVGFIQGVTELFPVSSLGHNVLIPALVGGGWAKDLNVAKPESPYLAFIVGLHVATAIGITCYFWRDWVRLIRGFVSSLRNREVETPDQKLAWMIILATIPVGIVGLAFEHLFRVIFGVPVRAAIFLAINGVILYAGERFRTRKSLAAEQRVLAERDQEEEQESELVGARVGGTHTSGQRALRQEQVTASIKSDRRLAAIGYLEAVLIGSAQCLALLAGISRDGVVMVAGMFRGLAREDAARFSFLLATPVILAAGVLKVPDLLGPLGNGIRPQILVGSLVSGIGAYISVRFLMKYFQTRTLTPFAIYCLVVGIGSVVYFH